MGDFYAYQSCYRCSGRVQPGTRDLAKYLLEKYGYTRSLGIYNCRDARGSTTLSIHACGRAFDLGIPMDGSRADTGLGDPIVRFLVENARELGLMGVIYNRARYDRKTPRGRYYGGVAPHYNHAHIEQISSAATSLTYSKIVEAVGPSQGGTMATYRKVINVPENSDGSPKDWAKKVIDSGIENDLINVEDKQIDDWERPLTAGEYWSFESRIASSGGGSADLSNYYTKSQANARFPQKGEKRSITL